MLNYNVKFRLEERNVYSVEVLDIQTLEMRTFRVKYSTLLKIHDTLENDNPSF